MCICRPEVKVLFCDNCKPNSMREHIESYYENLKQKALAKFDRGRKEHGENFSEIDYENEIENETIDLINYRAMEEYVKNNITSTNSN